MSISIRSLFLLTIGLLFCIVGCNRDRSHVLMPDDISATMEVHETFDAEASFEENLLPILTSRCALAGCHVADGPHGLDFRTYASFIAGGEHGPAFTPGNAEESRVVEVIALGIMPPRGPSLTAAEIQLFVDWINQQESEDHVMQDEHVEDHDEDMDDDHGEMDEDHDDDIDEDHDDMDDHMDEDHDDDDDNGHDDDN